MTEADGPRPEEDPIVLDCWVFTTDSNYHFEAHIPRQESLRIKSVGWENAGIIFLRDTEDRPLPQSLKDGTSTITDIWMEMELNNEYFLN